MNKGIAILFLIVAASLASTAELTETFVAGGVNAFPGEFPYLVSLQLTLFGQSAHFCGGTILSPVWILTVSSFIPRRDFHYLTLTLGSTLPHKFGEFRIGRSFCWST